MKFKKKIDHDITITPTVNGGFIVKVGCATLVYRLASELVSDLGKYLEDPEGVEKEYREACDRRVVANGDNFIYVDGEGNIIENS